MVVNKEDKGEAGTANSTGSVVPEASASTTVQGFTAQGVTVHGITVPASTVVERWVNARSNQLITMWSNNTVTAEYVKVNLDR